MPKNASMLLYSVRETDKSTELYPGRPGFPTPMQFSDTVPSGLQPSDGMPRVFRVRVGNVDGATVLRHLRDEFPDERRVGAAIGDFPDFVNVRARYAPVAGKHIFDVGLQAANPRLAEILF